MTTPEVPILKEMMSYFHSKPKSFTYTCNSCSASVMSGEWCDRCGYKSVGVDSPKVSYFRSP